MNEIGRQEGIVLTSDSNFQFDVIIEAGLLGGVRAGGEIRFYIKNPTGPVKEEMARQREALQKLLQAQEVQGLLNRIYALQTKYIKASELKKNTESKLEAYRKWIEARAAASEKGGVEHTKAKRRAAVKGLENIIRSQQYVINEAIGELKKLMSLEPGDAITLNGDFTAWRKLDKNVISIEEAVQKDIKESFGLVETLNSTSELLREKLTELEQLNYALAEANKKLTIKFMLKIMFGTDLIFGSRVALELRKDDKTDSRILMLRALNAMNEYEDFVYKSNVTKKELERKIDESIKRIGNLDRDSNNARQILEAKKRAYAEDKQKIPLSDVETALREYHSIQDSIIFERSNFQGLMAQIASITKGLTSETTALDAKFRINQDFVKALETTGQLSKAPGAESRYVSTTLAGDISYALQHSSGIQRSQNEIEASKRALEQKLVEIDGADRLKGLLKERTAIENGFQKEFKKDPAGTIKNFQDRAKQYKTVQRSIDEEVIRLNELIDKANDFVQEKILGLFPVRSTLDIEGVNVDGAYPLSIGATVKIRVGKDYFGEVKLFREAYSKAVIRQTGVKNSVADGLTRLQIAIRSVELKKKQEADGLKVLGEIAYKLTAAVAVDPRNAERLKKIELLIAQAKGRIDGLDSALQEHITGYKMALGIVPESEFDWSGILSGDDGQFEVFLNESINGSYNVQQMIDGVNNDLRIARAVQYMADGGYGIPIDVAVDTGGLYMYAELLNMQKDRSISVDKASAAGLVKKSERVHDDAKIGLYNGIRVSKVKMK
ncbi:MAG: hypothetical protein KJ584_03655, partial [Candidatus Omnitrophica bacterium]|nr:hypothetical protein [Candidatus Omnitrophota bacterium]